MDSIKRSPTPEILKCLCLETMRAQGVAVPPSIQAVPALVVSAPNEPRQLLFGKSVFDYLLIPNKGLLTGGAPPSVSSGASGNGTEASVNAGDPEAFHFSTSGRLGNSHAFVFLEGEAYSDEKIDTTRQYQWGVLDDEEKNGGGGQTPPLMNNAPPPGAHGVVSGHQGLGANGFTDTSVLENTRNDKSLPDLDKLRVARERDIQSLGGNSMAMPPPVPSR